MKIYAPFTEEQRDNLEAWQESPYFHPFTCPHRAEHPDYDGELFPTRNGWICGGCDYRQEWAHDFMVDGSALRIADEQAEYLKRLRKKSRE